MMGSVGLGRSGTRSSPKQGHQRYPSVPEFRYDSVTYSSNQRGYCTMKHLLTTSVFVLLILAAAGVASAAGGSASGNTNAVQTELQTLPLSFIPNTGQFESSVKFFVKGSDYNLYLLPDRVVVTSYTSGVSVESSIVGSDSHVAVSGVDPQTGRVNFIKGNQPSKWRTNIPTYRGVLYSDVLPGVDLYYRGQDGLLKREFVLAQGANPSSIMIRYSGIQGFSIAADGSLVVTTSAGELTESAPVCYQTVDGARVDVACEYRIIDPNTVGFMTGEYDPSLPLVIDPVLDYLDFIGGNGRDWGYAVDVQVDGSPVIVGSTTSDTFPVANTPTGNRMGNLDCFVTKLTPDGQTLVYSTYFGGTDTEEAYDVAIDRLNANVTLVTGYTMSTDFPNDLFGGANPKLIGNKDAFVAVFDENGALLESWIFAPAASDGFDTVALSVSIFPPNQEVYLTGYTFSSTFPSTDGSTKFVDNLNSDAFVIYASPYILPMPVFATYLGGDLNDVGTGIAVNNQTGNDYYVTGYTNSLNFPHSFPPAFTYKGNKDAFLIKYPWPPSTLTPWVYTWATFVGGAGDDAANGVAVDSIDNPVITGYTISANYPTTPYALRRAYSLPPFSDAFITRFNSIGTLNYSTYIGGGNTDVSKAIAIDQLDNIYITGFTSSFDFPSFNSSAIQPNKNPFQDAFVLMLNKDGRAINYSTYIGGSLDDTGTGIAVNGSNYTWVSGYTTSFDLKTKNTYEYFNQFFGMYYGDFEDAFLARISNFPTPTQINANFSSNVTTGSAALPVHFYDLSTGNPDTWLWNFGDAFSDPPGSATSTVKDPVHIYHQPGNYTVTLTASNSVSSDTEPKVNYIHVGEPSSVRFTANYTNCTPIFSILVANNTVVGGTPINRSFAFLLDQVPYGLSGYNFTLAINNSSVVNFTAVRRPHWMASGLFTGFLPNTTLPYFMIAPCSTATIYGIDLANPGYIGPGATCVELATLNISAGMPGNTTINVTKNKLQDDNYNDITLSPPEAEIILNVEVSPLYVVPQDPFDPIINTIPKDPDGDNLFEDIDGDGRLTFHDVTVFFLNFGWFEAVQDVRFFDFDHNGRFDYGDIISLFMEIIT
jgi:PKD repeat protein